LCNFRGVIQQSITNNHQGSHSKRYKEFTKLFRIMNPLLKLIFLGFEFIILFFGIPILIFLDTGFIHPSVVLLPVLIVIILLLRFSTDFTFKELIILNITRREVLRNAIVMLTSGIFMLLMVLLMDRENLFNLPKGNIVVWILLCTFYPVFSAYGQEIIYRTFLFRRYKILFKNDRLIILSSGIAFSFMHIVYYSPISMVLTLIGGLYLAYVYSKTRSVLFTAILHGILGILVFTVGLGHYFWLDMFEYIH